MACACGNNHTITLSDTGTVHSFGRNYAGELGLGHDNDVSFPTLIPNLPKINLISCGGNFTVCVDHEGFIWSFGSNAYGQLGTGNTTNFKVPQKLLDIPPVHSVSCGYQHTLIITNDSRSFGNNEDHKSESFVITVTSDSNLWSYGANNFGQLCHGDTEDRSKPQKTFFSNISKISAGWYHSLFENNKGEIFSCGFNEQGQCGLGHFNHPQITPIFIPDTPPNIFHFVCGAKHSLFLDSEGNVFSVGSNEEGQLGLGHNGNQNVLNKIPNIPPIQTISCVSSSCYLIDFEGNLWTFGANDYGKLGRGDTMEFNTPKIINTLKDIQQISYGCCGNHFLARNSQNQIFGTGYNYYGQLGTRHTQSEPIPKEMDSQFSSIWRDEFHTRAKSARK